MKQKLNSKNPYKNSINSKFNGSKAYLSEFLLLTSNNYHLDFGAHDGELISTLKKKNLISSGIGLDANREVVEANHSQMPEGVELKAININTSLPFNDSSFDSISIIGVIEHVVEQKRLIKELHRILIPGGSILVAVPGKHFFSFLDMGNWKFVFPRLHERYIVLTKGEQFFKDHYSHNPNGLYGDVEIEKFWHEHFKKNDLKSLLEECGFNIDDLDGFGFFNRVITNTAYFSPSFMTKFFNRLVELDALYFSSTEIWALAKKTNN
ncbi:class I SAM-dependent methyltransferase [Gammaproteobacteria bacterium]|nr:class I SAM-dependent methyltransferase [Gammaproteobacteria bacterium]